MKQSAYVYISLGGHYVPCGYLEYFPDGDYCSFRYGRKYLLRPDALPVDPRSLPLSMGDIQAVSPRGTGLFSGLRDATPDNWGRHVLALTAERPLSELEILVAWGTDRIGALACGPDLGGPKRMAPWLPNQNAPDNPDLGELLATAERMAAREDIPESLKRHLIRNISTFSAGGARPKGLLTYDGGYYLAKFPHPEDPWCGCRIEYATMTLAGECGIRIPEMKVLRVLDKDVLLVRRFDIEEQGERVLRRHMISAYTLLGVKEDGDWGSYRDMADALRVHGGPKVAEDCREIFRRMVYNIMVSNLDDHPRNHGFFYEGSSLRLSPAYDIMPSDTPGKTRYLALGVGKAGRLATLENALSRCEAFGVSREEAYTVINDMSAHMRGWREHFNACGVTSEDIQKLAPCFSSLELTRNDELEADGPSIG